MQITNLLDETIRALTQNNKSIDDIYWIGNNEEYVGIDDFLEFAKTLNYNSGFGTAHVCEDLVIMGRDWWLERWEYDGSEGWTFKTRPQMPKKRTTNIDKAVVSKSKHLRS